MEVREYSAIIWRWKWLLVLCTILAAGAAFVVSSLTTPVFEASTTLLVNQPPDSRTSEYTAILASERLALTYTQMLTKRPVLTEAVSRLGLDIDLEDLQRAIDVQLIRDTQLIELKAENTDPSLAATLANSIVEVFTEQNDALQASRFAASKTSLGTQLDKISEQIQAKEAAIADLATPQTDTDKAELDRLQTELAQHQASYITVLQSYEELRIAEARLISNIIQVEPAEPPEKPIRPRTLLNTLLAGVAGGLIALGAAFLIEYLDDTIKSSEDVVRVTGLPVIGYVPDSKKLSVSGESQKLMISEPNSLLAESFRSMRTNIELAGIQGTPRSILVASFGPGDGKTAIATQLAVSIAQGGKKVVLIDANLRQPRLHDYLGIKNELGLSDMLVDDLVPQVVAHEMIHWRLRVITSGTPVENPAELMGSVWVLKVLTRLREQADVAIFDGPPFVVYESFVLASKLESVLMVMKYGHTREADATQTMERLARSHANPLGVVMNRVPDNIAHSQTGNLVYGYREESRASNPGNIKPSLPGGQVLLRNEARDSGTFVEEKRIDPEVQW